MQIGEENFLPGKEETRRNPDGFQEFLTQPDEKFSVKMRAGAYWYSFLNKKRPRRMESFGGVCLVYGSYLARARAKGRTTLFSLAMASP